MTPIDEDWVRAEVARRRSDEDVRLEAARRAARSVGKEAFDLDAFEQIYDTTSDLGHVPPREERERRWALKYYVDYPAVMTMRDLAAHLETLDVYRT